MKIGLFTDGYYPQINGVAVSIDELKDSLNNMHHKVFVVAPKFPDYKDVNGDVFRLKSFRYYKNPELRFSYMFPDKIFQKVLKSDFDIIHGFSGGAIPSLGLAIAKFTKKPYVFTYNTRFHHYTHYVPGGKFIRPKAVEKIVELYCNVCDHVIAPADHAKKELIEFGVKKPITVIPNGIDIKKFKPGNKNYLRKKLGLSQSDKIIIYVGRLAKEKSVDFLIKTFVKVAHEAKNTYFVIVGDGQEREHLEKLVKDLGLAERVFFLGLIAHNNLPQVYNGADVFAFASRSETQGLVVLEALACGTVVVTIKDKVFGEFIKDGVDGFMIDRQRDVFAKKLLQVLEDKDLREKIAKKAREKAEKFSLEEVAKKFDALYKSLQ